MSLPETWKNTGREVMNIFHRLHEEGNTIVLITHDRDIAAEAQRLIHIKDGYVREGDENALADV